MINKKARKRGGGGSRSKTKGGGGGEEGGRSCEGSPLAGHKKNPGMKQGRGKKKGGGGGGGGGDKRGYVQKVHKKPQVSVIKERVGGGCRGGRTPVGKVYVPQGGGKNTFEEREVGERGKTTREKIWGKETET